MGRRILVVDDDPQYGALLLRILRLEGYEAELAAGEDAAYAQTEGSCPELALVDVVLGAANGWEVARRIAAKGCIVILLTGGAVDEDMRKDAKALGLKTISEKPFCAEELSTLVHAALRGR